MSGSINISQLKYTVTNNNDISIGDATNGPAHESKYITFQTDDVPGFYAHPHIKCFWDSDTNLWKLAFSEDGIVASEFARLQSNNTFTGNNYFYGNNFVIGDEGLDTLLVNSTTTFNSPVTFQSAVQINGDFAVSGNNVTLDSYNVNIKDKLLALNYLGSAGSGFATGIGVEEAGGLTGWVKTSPERLGWVFKAPASAGQATFLFAPEDRSYTLPDKSGTVALISDLVSNKITVVNQEYYTFLTTTYPFDVPHIKLFATGGTAPYTWSIVYDTDTTWDSAVVTGDFISGDLGAPGFYTVKVHVIDPNAVSDTKILRIEISNAASTGGGDITPPLIITSQDLYSFSTATDPAVTPYAVNIPLTATGGTPPYSWLFVSGTITSAVITGSSASTLSGTLAAWSTIYDATVKVTDSKGVYSSKTLSATVTDSALPAKIVSFTGTTVATGGLGSSSLSIPSATPIKLNYSYQGTVTTAVITRSVGGAISNGDVIGSASGSITLDPGPTALTVYTLTINGSITKTVTVDINAVELVAYSTKGYFTGSDNTVFAALANATGTVEVFANVVSGSPAATLSLSSGDTYTPTGEVASFFDADTWKAGGAKYQEAVNLAGSGTLLRLPLKTITDYKGLGFIHGAQSSTVAVTTDTTFIFVYNRGTATETRAQIFVDSIPNSAPLIGTISPRSTLIPTNPTGNTVINGVPQFTGNLAVPNFPLQIFDTPVVLTYPRSLPFAGTGYHNIAYATAPIYDALLHGTVVMREGSTTGPILGTLFINNAYQPLTGYPVPTTTKNFYFVLTDNTGRTDTGSWNFAVSTSSAPSITQFIVDFTTINITNGVYDHTELSFTTQWANGGTGVLYANNAAVKSNITTSATPFTITSPSANTIYKLVVTGTDNVSTATSSNIAVTVNYSSQTAIFTSLRANPPAYLSTTVNNSSSFDAYSFSNPTFNVLGAFANGTCAYTVYGTAQSGTLLNNVNKQIATASTALSTRVLATVTGAGGSTDTAAVSSAVAFEANFNAPAAVVVLDGRKFYSGNMTLSSMWRSQLAGLMPWGVPVGDPSFTIFSSAGTTYNPGSRTIVAQGTMATLVESSSTFYENVAPPLVGNNTTTYVAQITAAYDAYPGGVQTLHGALLPPSVSLQRYNDVVTTVPITSVVTTIYSARPTTNSPSGTGTVVTLNKAYDPYNREVDPETWGTISCLKNKAETVIFGGFPSHVVPEYSPVLSAGGHIIIRGMGDSTFNGLITITVAVSGQTDTIFTFDNDVPSFRQIGSALIIPVAKTLNISSATVTVTVNGPTAPSVPSTWASVCQIVDILYVDSPGSTYDL